MENILKDAKPIIETLQFSPNDFDWRLILDMLRIITRTNWQSSAAGRRRERVTCLVYAIRLNATQPNPTFSWMVLS